MPINPEPLAGGNVYKLTSFTNLGIQGWSESYYAWMASDQNQLLTMKSAAQLINKARVKPLTSAAGIEGQRIESVANRRDSFAFAPPDLAMGTGQAGGATGGPWDGWLFRISDISGQVWDNRIYTGWDAASVDYVATRTNPGVLPIKVSQFLSDLTRALTTTQTTKDGPTWRYAIRSYDRTVAVSPVINVTDVTLNESGRVVIVLETPTTTIQRNDIVQLSVNRQRCVTGLSGRHRVLNVSLTPGPMSLTLNKVFCCSASDLETVLGTVRVIKPAYYPIDTVSALRVVKKDRGRAFFATVGRRSARCC